MLEIMRCLNWAKCKAVYTRLNGSKQLEMAKSNLSHEHGNSEEVSRRTSERERTSGRAIEVRCAAQANEWVVRGNEQADERVTLDTRKGWKIKGLH